MMTVDKLCERCGEMMFDVHPEKRFCFKCAKIRAHERRKLFKNQSQPETKKPRHTKEHKLTVAEIDKLAKEAGMTYGMYVSKYGV